MDDTTLKIWEALHRRLSRGETLNAEEQTVHAAGLQQLDEEETIPGSIEELRRARERTLELREKYYQMKARYEALEAERLEIESRLSERDRQLLGIGN